MPTCPYCGKGLAIDEVGVIKNTVKGLNTRCYYHISCHKLAQITPKNEWPHNKEKASVRDEIDVYAEMIYDFLLRDMKFSPDMAKIKSQMKNFTKKDMYAEGIYKSVRYFYEIKMRGKVTRDEGEGGIGIVPYVYSEARNYWHSAVANQNSRAAKIDKQIEAFKNREQVKVKKQAANSARQKYLVDLDNI